VSDRERLLAYLEQHGSVTSYEIRTKALSGNPSQRVTELRDRGYDITAEQFRRDGRPCTRYTLRGESVRREGPRQVADDWGSPSAAGDVGSRGSDRGGRFVPSAVPDQRAVATSGEVPPKAGGDGPPSHTSPAQLFEMEPESVRPRSHYESEAA
jgi:hypothetical protein